MCHRNPAFHREEWYRWFYEKQCGLWNGDKCPIMQVQKEHVVRPDLRFYPEAIWGNPENPVWFMALNPGQCRRNDQRCDREGELSACVNTVKDKNISFEEYRRRHDWIQTYDRNPHHPVFRDSVTSAAMGLLLDEPRLVCVDDPGVKGTQYLTPTHPTSSASFSWLSS